MNPLRSLPVHLSLFVVLTAPAPGQPSPTARGGPTLSAFALGDTTIGLALGRWSDSPRTPSAALAAGCRAGDPRLTAILTHTATGWSRSDLPRGRLTGLPFGHRRRIHALQLGPPERDGHRDYRVGRLETEEGVPGFRLARGRDALAHLVVAIDRWQFAVVEQYPTGAVLVSRYTSEGPDAIVRLLGAAPLSAPWLGRAAIVGAAGTGQSVIVFAREPQGAVHATPVTGPSWPPLLVAAESAVAGAWWRGAPVVIAVDGGRATAWRPSATGWEPEEIASLEAAGGAGPTLAAAAATADGDIIVGILRGARLATYHAGTDGRWERPVVHDVAAPTEPAATRRDRSARSTTAGGLAMRVVFVGVPAGTLVVVLTWLWLRSRRRRS